MLNVAPAPLTMVTLVPPANVTVLELRFIYLNTNIVDVDTFGTAATICAAVAVVSVLPVPRLIAKNVPSMSSVAVIV